MKILSSSNGNRIIPTRVGTRAISALTSSSVGDHPHACGDKVCLHSLLRLLLGSSPRVWGQVEVQKDESGNVRIIPTRVGTRTFPSRHHQQDKDHPHACGDKIGREAPPTSFLGSSPRVWGQAERFCAKKSCGRIIPTRVGTR